MRKILAIILAMSTLVAFSSCVSVSFADNGFSEGIQGVGPMITKEFPVESFTDVIIAGDFELVYSNQPSNVVKIYAQENFMQYAKVEVNNNTLRIDSTKHIIDNGENATRIYISSPEIKFLSAPGLIKVLESDTIKTDKFILNVSGAGEGELDFDVNELFVNISGATQITLSGNANKAEYEMSGTGYITADELKTQDTKLDISGAGGASVFCENSLDVKLSGMGQVTYKGSPQIKEDISGMGKVVKAQ